MNNVVLLVYGDSLSLPRAADDISCFDTYPELLRGMLESATPALRVAVLNRSRGGAPIGALFEQFVDDSTYIGPETGRILVIQCGIVDCAPRPVSPNVKTAIGRLPTVLRWAVARVLHYARPLLLRCGLIWRNTDRLPFAEALGRWIVRGVRAADRVYVINIAPTTPAMNRHSPGLAASVNEYNATIASVVASARSGAVRLIDVHRAITTKPTGSPDYVSAADGHHITRAGHMLYAEMIAMAELTEPAR